REKRARFPIAPPVNTWIRPNRSPPSRFICSFHNATAPGLTPGSGMWEPSRKTTRRPNVQRMRLRSSGILKMFWNDWRICMGPLPRLLLLLRCRLLRLRLRRLLRRGGLLLGRRLVVLDRGRVDRRKLLDRAARLGDLLLGALGERLGFDGQLLGQVPRSEDLHAVALAAHQARGLEGRAVDGRARRELLLELADVDDLVIGLEVRVVESELGEAAEHRHLSAFEVGAEAGALPGVLALPAAAAGL